MAGASHVTVIDPAAVPPGFLATHVDVQNFPIWPFARAVKDQRADVFVQLFQVAPNSALPWHSHPGPAIVTVVRGALGYQQEVNGECVTTWYTAGTGFIDPGFGHVHRGLGGPEGFDACTTFVTPSGTPNPVDPGRRAGRLLVEIRAHGPEGTARSARRGLRASLGIADDV